MKPLFAPVSSEELRSLQLNLLDEFDRHCRRVGLRYYIWAGTLLGTMRNAGFIPWDDDIDVAMPREDFERFKQEFPTSQLADHFMIHDFLSDPTYPHLFMKIGDPRALVLGDAPAPICVNIDIFPIDQWPAGKLKSAFGNFILRVLLCWRQVSIPVRDRPGRKRWKQALLAMRKPVRTTSILRRANLWTDRFIRRQKGSSVTVAVVYAGPLLKLDRSAYGDPTWLTFEGRTLPAPANPDAVLSHLYGDWRTPPPPGKRHGHLRKDIVWVSPQIVSSLYALDHQTRATVDNLAKLREIAPTA